MVKIVLDYKWCFIWALVVIILCTLPSNNFEGAPSYPGMDKIIHCGLFFIFCTLMYHGVIQQFCGKAKRWWPVFIVSFMSFLFAGATELIQFLFFTSRSGDWFDLFADAIGIGMAGFAYLLTYVNRK
ncbi:VanZ family protein [Sphingobacterium kitahiroshimense]|uniref:VanZ family protein n=2 Tax=Sphingobacterium kitahiroshimense TaxID=470446 RepID=A0ABV0BY61_9SPHI